MGDVRRENTGEVERVDVERNDVTAGVADDTNPGAVRGGFVPGRQSMLWVVGNGGFYRKKGAVFRNGAAGGWSEVEMEKKEEKKKEAHC